jgi:hypothetical protein
MTGGNESCRPFFCGRWINACVVVGSVMFAFAIRNQVTHD